MVTMFTISSVYHGLKPTLGKKVMQVLDHCTIYFLIAGTYTVILLSAIRPENPVLAWVLFGFEWGMVALATTLTAIDLKKYRVFSMICYIGMGWAIIFFAKQAMQALTFPGFLLLLLGGIAYTVGSILYGLGKRRKWMHSVFHIRRFGGAASVLLRAVLCNLTKKSGSRHFPGRKNRHKLVNATKIFFRHTKVDLFTV